VNACGEHVNPESTCTIRLCLWKQESPDFRQGRVQSFSKIYKASDIFFMLEINIKTFTPYVVTMLLFLYFSSSFLNKANQVLALFTIFLLNILYFPV
jgi:hypothetical protein